MQHQILRECCDCVVHFVHSLRLQSKLIMLELLHYFLYRHRRNQVLLVSGLLKNRRRRQVYRQKSELTTILQKFLSFNNRLSETFFKPSDFELSSE